MNEEWAFRSSQLLLCVMIMINIYGNKNAKKKDKMRLLSGDLYSPMINNVSSIRSLDINLLIRNLKTPGPVVLHKRYVNGIYGCTMICTAIPTQ